MVRIIIVFIPLVLPILTYMSYRFFRYRVWEKNATPPAPISIFKLFLIGLLLVAVNIIFLVRFESMPAETNIYQYPTYQQPEADAKSSKN